MNKTITSALHFVLTLLLSYVCISSTPLQAEEVEFDLKALADFGTRKYKMTWLDRSSRSAVEHERGTMTFSAKVKENSVLLKNVTRMYLPDGKRYIECKASCLCSADKSLSALRMEGEVRRSDGIVLHETNAVIENGKITNTCTSRGKSTKKEDEWAAGTILDFAVFFLVPQLPKENGRSVSIENVMPTPTNTIRNSESRVITCKGIDRRLSTESVKLTKFANNAKGEKEGIIYWVDGKGLLRRVQLNAENRLDLIMEQDADSSDSSAN